MKSVVNNALPPIPRVPKSFVLLVPNDNPLRYPPSNVGLPRNAKSAVVKNGFAFTIDPPCFGGFGGLNDLD